MRANLSLRSKPQLRRNMLRSVRDAVDFIGVMIYAVSLASVLKISGKAEAEAFRR